MRPVDSVTRGGGVQWVRLMAGSGTYGSGGRTGSGARHDPHSGPGGSSRLPLWNNASCTHQKRYLPNPVSLRFRPVMAQTGV